MAAVEKRWWKCYNLQFSADYYQKQGVPTVLNVNKKGNKGRLTRSHVDENDPFVSEKELLRVGVEWMALMLKTSTENVPHNALTKRH